MYELVSKSGFRDAFKRYDREHHFSYDGLGALYDYLEDIEIAENGYELDVVGLCCDYVEEEIEKALDNYSLKSIEELEENTCVVWHDEERVLYVQY